MKISTLWALFLVLSAPLFSSEQKIIVGTTSGYAPYVSLNSKGEYEGFDIDFSRELAKKLNRTLEIKDFGSMPGLMMALNQGKIDLLIWAISITEKRLEKLNMVHYQGKLVDSMPFIFWKTIPEEIASIDDLTKNPSWIFSCEAGTSQEDFLRTIPKIKIKTMDKISDVVLDLKYGKCFAAPIDPSLISIYQEKFPELKVKHLPMPKSEHVLGVGVCLAKGNTELTRQVEKAVDQLKAEGKIAELEKKWKIEG